MPKISMGRAIAGLLVLAACIIFIRTEPARGLGSTPVTVVNPTDIAKAEGGQHPYHFRVDCNSLSAPVGGEFGCGGVVSAPPNQRLAIEYVSGSCAYNSGS